MFCAAEPPSDAHHFPHKGMGGGGDWHDRWSVPACRKCHTAYHEKWTRDERDMMRASIWQKIATLMLAYDEPVAEDGSEL